MFRPNARSHSITSQESYSAVIITDMVADVNVNPELEGGTKPTKEETNLAFDGHTGDEIKNSHLDGIESSKVNGSGISKGVILNAVQFNSNDSKKTFDEKPLQLSASLAVPTLTQPPSESKGFKDMTLTRKIAFGFSFLPSIFFILCFAVILPCKIPKQCVEETWSVTFNNTEPVSGLEIANKIVLTAFKEDKNVLLELEKNNGKSAEIEIPSTPVYLKCGEILYKNKRECMVMDNSGKVYAFNDTHSIFLWEFSEGENLPSSPLILSGCHDKLEDISIAVSNTIIKFLRGGNQISNFLVTHCDSVPVKLMSWKIGNSVDIVFVCDKDGKDRLVKISKSAWCPTNHSPPEKDLILSTGALNSLKESIIKPLGDNGLVIWSKHNVSMVHANGTLLWKITNMSHPDENRFIFHGRFPGENKMLAFIGSNLISGLQVALLNPSDGSFVKKLNITDNEAQEIVHIEGKERDFALLLLKKPAKNTVTAAFNRISDISSTIVSILSNEKLTDDISSPTVQELAILDLESGSVKDIIGIEDSASKSTMTAITDENGILNMYLLSTYPQLNATKIKKIEVANWDDSSKPKCLAKK